MHHQRSELWCIGCIYEIKRRGDISWMRPVHLSNLHFHLPTSTPLGLDLVDYMW